MSYVAGNASVHTSMIVRIVTDKFSFIFNNFSKNIQGR